MSIIKTNWLLLFRATIGMQCKNEKKHMTVQQYVDIARFGVEIRCEHGNAANLVSSYATVLTYAEFVFDFKLWS